MVDGTTSPANNNNSSTSTGNGWEWYKLKKSSSQDKFTKRKSKSESPEAPEVVRNGSAAVLKSSMSFNGSTGSEKSGVNSGGGSFRRLFRKVF